MECTRVRSPMPIRGMALRSGTGSSTGGGSRGLVYGAPQRCSGGAQQKALVHLSKEITAPTPTPNRRLGTPTVPSPIWGGGGLLEDPLAQPDPRAKHGKHFPAPFPAVQILPNNRKYSGIFGSIRECSETIGSIREYSEIFGNIRKYSSCGDAGSWRTDVGTGYHSFQSKYQTKPPPRRVPRFGNTRDIQKHSEILVHERARTPWHRPLRWRVPRARARASTWYRMQPSAQMSLRLL